jgi:hypothetical protein
VAEVADSIHINSHVLFLFSLFHFAFFMFHVSLFMFHCSCFIVHVSYFIFQKYIRHEQCGFPQEDV